MPSHQEHKTLRYTSLQIKDLVMDIKKYPDFLPWCIGANITKIIDENNLEAQLAIHFKGFLQRYTSKVTLSQNNNKNYKITTTSIDGPFKNLINIWNIKQDENLRKQCHVDFFIDFEFKSRIFNKMITPIFTKATDKMIKAFEQRANELYL